MTIDLPADLERFIHDEVQAGRYPSEQEVVRRPGAARDRTPPEPGAGVDRCLARRRRASRSGCRTRHEGSREAVLGAQSR